MPSCAGRGVPSDAEIPRGYPSDTLSAEVALHRGGPRSDLPTAAAAMDASEERGLARTRPLFSTQGREQLLLYRCACESVKCINVRAKSGCTWIFIVATTTLTERTLLILLLSGVLAFMQEILKMLEMVYGESAMKRRTVYKWMDLFKKGRESIDDDLFPKVKNIMADEHFVAVNTIKRETTKLLKEFTKEDMQHYFQEWEKRWTKCILSRKEYFEDDHIPDTE
ncbi:hypothetical protein ALC56_08373 [Trachymyrmex septentrionalis]|uniref:Mos1 transposase HTH domain-containing protein n=1 Tax=Trachymyrmex septentrionalis TaxID=34720 RepID=A0A195F9N3_9HYME|nr:hypothetical protein ALC56_08373 [Trachymyrmex septentrionalis]